MTPNVRVAVDELGKWHLPSQSSTATIKVSSYSVEKSPTERPTNQSTHGDLIFDEMTTVEDKNKFQHKLIFEDATIKSLSNILILK